MKNTELPWHTGIGCPESVHAEDSACICDCDCGEPNETILDNAAFIVKACNNHENLIEVIQAALRISDLWLPQTVDAEHVGEAKALHSMRSLFLQAIKEAEK